MQKCLSNSTIRRKREREIDCVCCLTFDSIHLIFSLFFLTNFSFTDDFNPSKFICDADYVLVYILANFKIFRINWLAPTKVKR